MTHISRTKTGQFIVAVLGRNGKVLMTSEPLKTRVNAIKNIAAIVSHFNKWDILVQDNTKEAPVILLVDHDSRVIASTQKPGKPYQPK